MARLRIVPLALATITLAGALGPLASIDAEGTTMTFQWKTVDATSLGTDLYEPSVAAAAGSVYVSGHSPPTGGLAPTFVTHDGGNVWTPLYGNGHGDGDEGIVAVDAGGNAWEADFKYPGGTKIPLWRYCDDGVFCDVNDNTYAPIAGCGSSLDRVWTAAGNGKVLITNNAGQNSPPRSGNRHVAAVVVDAFNFGGAHEWTCIGEFDAGPPAIRNSDGAIAIPVNQHDSLPNLHTIYRGPDLAHLTVETTYEVATSALACAMGVSWGFASFSNAGTLFYASALTGAAGAASKIGLLTWDTAGVRHETSLETNPIAFMWLTAHPGGEGALVTWASTLGACPPAGGVPALNFYAAHVRLDAFGNPTISDVSLVASSVVNVCGDYIGSSVGPDGRAYVVTYSSPGATSTYCPGLAGRKPLRLYVQTGGPLL